MSKEKSFFFDRSKALYSKDETLAITHLGNIPKIAELYEAKTFLDFVKKELEADKL